MLKLSGGERGEIRENPERSASLYLFLSLTSDVTGVAAFQNLETEKCVWNNSPVKLSLLI